MADDKKRQALPGGTQKTASAKSASQTPKQPKPKKDNLVWKGLFPYLLVLVALLLLLCNILGTALGAEGAGAIGNFIYRVGLGFFGLPTWLFPVVIGYVGVRLVWFNIKYPLKERAHLSPEDAKECRHTARRNALFIFLASAFLVLASTLFAVWGSNADLTGNAINGGPFKPFGHESYWYFAYVEYLGGGIIGGMLGWLFLTAFQQTISVIVLIIVLSFVFLFMIGLTPDRVVVWIAYLANNIHEKNKEKRAIRKAEKEAEREALAAAEAEERSALDGNGPDTRALGAGQSRLSSPADRTGNGYTETRGGGFDDFGAPRRGINRGMTEEEIANLQIGPSEEQKKQNEQRFRAAEEAGVFDTQSGRKTIRNEAQTGEIDLSELGLDTGNRRVGKDFGNEESMRDAQGLDEILSEVGDETEDTPAEPIAVVIEKEENESGAKKRTAQGPIDFDAIPLEEAEHVEQTFDYSGEEYAQPEEEIPYEAPPIDLLNPGDPGEQTDMAEMRETSTVLCRTLSDYGVRVVGATFTHGPTVTRYELTPERGTKLSKIEALSSEVTMALKAKSVRIQAPIPGMDKVGVEVPNKKRDTVYLRELIDAPIFTDNPSRTFAAVGKDSGGSGYYMDIAKAPHILIAGATGQGKSVAINCILVSLLYKSSPRELKFILIDPKKVEFTVYRSIPHLYVPVVNDCKKAAGALASAVNEMERRYEIMERYDIRKVDDYNKMTETDGTLEYLPKIVIVIDELADLMAVAGKEVELSISRLAAKARAAGIHLIIGTQRPSKDVISGTLKGNIPARIACTVASYVNSMVILDEAGAEKLTGRGDMLCKMGGDLNPTRVQGAFVSDPELKEIVTYIAEHNSPAKYNEKFMTALEEETRKLDKESASMDDMPSAPEGGDNKFRDAVKLAIEEGKISTSLMQRRLGVGYGRAAKIIDSMERLGYVGPQDGNKPREVLLTLEDFMQKVATGTLGGEE